MTYFPDNSHDPRQVGPLKHPISEKETKLHEPRLRKRTDSASKIVLPNEESTGKPKNYRWSWMAGLSNLAHKIGDKIHSIGLFKKNKQQQENITGEFNNLLNQIDEILAEMTGQPLPLQPITPAAVNDALIYFNANFGGDKLSQIKDAESLQKKLNEFEKKYPVIIQLKRRMESEPSKPGLRKENVASGVGSLTGPENYLYRGYLDIIKRLKNLQ